MNKSIKTVFTAVVLSVLAQAGMAQPGGGQGGGMNMGMNSEAQIKELIAQLDVTSEQEPAFREAMAQIGEMRRAAMQEMGGAAGQGGQGGGMMRQGQGQGQGGDHAGHGGSGDQAAHAAQNGSGNMRQGQGQGGGMMRQNAQNGDHAGHGANVDQSADHAGHGAQNGSGNMRQGQGQGGGMMRQNGGGQGAGMERMMERRAEMQKQSEEILGKVLTADQLARYSQLQNERMEQMMSRGQNQQ